MTVANTCRTIFGLLLSLHFVLAQVLAQDCYYPNGDVSTVDAPCSSSGGMCCAVGWECLSNGLCYYEPDGYYERRSCTDQSWGSDCSQFCVTGNSIVGNEAIQQCSDGHWCCDADRHQSVEFCCDSKNASLVIDVPDGNEVGFISSLRPVTPAASASRSTSRPSTTSDKSSGSITPPSSTSQDPTPTTITNVARTSNSNGQAIIITSIITSIATPTSTNTVSTASKPSTSSSSSKTMTIIIAVIVPIVILSLLALAYLLYRRHLRNKPAQLALAPPEMVNMYRDAADTPELNGDYPPSHPAGAAMMSGGGGNEDNKVERKSELYGSVPIQQQHSPAVSSLTNSNTNRNSAATDPPLYSPVSGQYQPSPTLGGGQAALPQVQEEQAHELWGGDFWPGQTVYHTPSPPPQALQPGYVVHGGAPPSIPGEPAEVLDEGQGDKSVTGVQGGDSGVARPKDI